MTPDESKKLVELGERMASVETKLDTHNERADEVKEVVVETQQSMLAHFTRLKCDTHTERMSWHSKLIWSLYSIIVVYGLVAGGMWAWAK